MPTKVIAGHFEYQDIEQEIDVIFSEHKTDKNGKLMFEADGATPVMHDVPQKKTVTARQRVWIPQQRVELNEEEMKMYNATQERHKRVQARVAAKELSEKRQAVKNKLLEKFNSEALLSDEPIDTIRHKHREKLTEIESKQTIGELQELEETI